MEDRMTSKLVVNTIEADTGISSVSFASSISLSSTSKFFFSDAGIDIGPDTNINRPATGVLGFNINGTERVRINSSGRLGLGTNNPDTTLTVQSGGDAQMSLKNSSGTTKAYVGTAGAFGSAGTDDLRIRSDSSNIVFGFSGAERLRIKSDGKTGIGTDNPSAKLEVRDSASTGIIVRSNSTQSTDTNKALRVRNNSDTNVFSVSHKGFTEIKRGELGTYLKVGGDDASNGRALTFTSSNTASNGALHTLDAISGNGAIALATAGTERFRVDSDGYVTKPHNAMFKAVITSSQSVSSNGWHVAPYNSDSATGCFDIGNNFNTSNHRFTAPVTGYYQFGLNQRIDSGDGNYFRVAFTVNGATPSGQYPYGHAIYRDIDGFSYYTFSITSLIYLTAGQYVRAEAYSSSDTNWTLQDESQFYGYLVG